MEALIPHLGHVACFLTLISYASRSVAVLRVFAILASATAVYHGFVSGTEPLWIPIGWNALFLFANFTQLTMNRGGQNGSVQLTPVEEFLSKTVLMNFPPAEVKTFAAFAEEEVCPKGRQLIQINTELDRLYCILHGSVSIIINEKQVGELVAGNFVGEMSLLTRSRTRADVYANSDLRLLSWKYDGIEKWVDEADTRLALLQTAMGTQVVDSLLRAQDSEHAAAAKERQAG